MKRLDELSFKYCKMLLPHRDFTARNTQDLIKIDQAKTYITCYQAGYLQALGDCEFLAVALDFYGFKSIHNPLNKDAGQYWNDVGISDHGSRAREALEKWKELNE